ncbi:MAG TPA: UDP-N-acetylmuramoyl-tripeptide--D-alanyl-D-alanine ligase [Anaerolineae bacterium]|nr:UDP-N-acetylmuramoyl-tripeptide--D-alanyl-D-alanine ligase [Anaerolineae bacterium]
MERPIILTIEHLVTALAGRPAPELKEAAAGVEIPNAVVDSRRAGPGSLFVALRGQRHDGHDFISQAVSAGAVAVLAERCPAELAGITLPGGEPLPAGLKAGPGQPICLVVPDSLAALQRVASYWRRQHDVRVVAVTGSVGKTTSKEIIAAVLGQRYRCLKSEGNYNNEIGLPLTLLHLRADHERVVLEMGMYELGEIAQLAAIALPHVGVVTDVGPSHLERLGSIERIAQAKAELPQALPPAAEGGVAILNEDDSRVRAMAGLTRARVFTYGLSPTADLWADEIESQGLEGIRFRLHHAGESLHVRLPLLGRHSVHTALRGAAAGLVEGLSWEEIITGLRDQESELRLVAVPGPSGSTILDDTYNASPASSLAALNLLEELPLANPGARKIAVLGDMYELGSYEEEGHRVVGRRAREVADLLVAVGKLGSLMGQEAMKAGMAAGSVHLVEDNVRAIAVLRDLLGSGPGGDVLLVKGSRGLEMEQIVAALQERVLP